MSFCYFDFSFSDEMIAESAHQASDFFHIDEPMIIAEDFTTGVYTNSDISPADDILIFSRDQLYDMGITERDGLDLVMTHEAAHRALQGMDHGFDAHEQELCCDFMAGVRAGLNDIDVSQMKYSLFDTLASETHPGGIDRVEAIDAGFEFAIGYINQYGHAPTFSECLENFQNNADAIGSHDWDEYFDAINLAQDDVVFNGYTQSEINSKVDKAEHDMGYWKSEIRRHADLLKTSSYPETEEMHIRDATRKYEAACSDYNKWKSTKPDPVD